MTQLTVSCGGAHPVPRGRLLECGRLDRLLDAVRSGESHALVIRGEPGVGKTALLKYLCRQASGCRIVRARGVQSETDLGFAALHQLCGPLLDRVEKLPDPQRDALNTVFGLRHGVAPDRFLVGLALLTLLSDTAAEQPLVCIVDDAQWLDPESVKALAYVARHLLSEPVAMVFAARGPGDDLTGLPQLLLGGLGEEHARTLLAKVIPGRLDERVRDRIVAETRGNPRALLELPRGLSPAQLAGGFGLPEALSPAGPVDEGFPRRLEELPAETRLLLLVAAAEPAGDPALMWRAAARLGIECTALDPAAQTKLLDVGTHVRFPGPLVRSAVYRSASDDERRNAHGALADATDPALEPDRRAWHRAQATRGPNEDVAAELERSVGPAQDRGGLAAGAAFLARAADLTTDPARRAERRLAAAQVNLRAGAFDAALRLLATAQTGPLNELGRARVDLLHAQIGLAQNRGCEAPQQLLRAARTLEALDVQLSRDAYLDAWSAALFAGQRAGAGGLLDVSKAMQAAPEAVEPPRARDLLLGGLALVVSEGRPAAAPLLQRALAAFAGSRASAEEVVRWGRLATAAALFVWDYETALAVSTHQVQLARESGALEVLPVALDMLGQTLALGGDLAAAAPLIAEAAEVTEATGARVAPCGAHAHWAHAVAMNALGQYEAALAAATEATQGPPELFVSIWALSELVEAASRTQNIEIAERALSRLGEHTQATRADWALGVQARGCALLSQGGDAERLYREAVDRLGHTRLRPELARAHLLYGEWLRRESRRVDAREQLRTAHEMLVAIGMEEFAERARGELLATGEKVRSRRPETRDELTHQEAQIARLAREGLTNPEIAAQLFLSPRTVEWHLRKVFTKLGIRSRRQLARVLPARESELVAT